MNHLLVVPIVLPLLAGALLLLLEKAGGRWAQRARPLALVSAALLLLCALGLMVQADGGAVQSYLLGNWRAPWGIALALDRSTALLLVLTALLGLAALLDACAGEDRRGAQFHALLQFQLMGLNGAFLTADLFNLFVFFEVLLAASYGLCQQRVVAGLLTQRRHTRHRVADAGAGLHSLAPGFYLADQLGGRFSIKACTPSSAASSIMLQAMVWAASV